MPDSKPRLNWRDPEYIYWLHRVRQRRWMYAATLRILIGRRRPGDRRIIRSWWRRAYAEACHGFWRFVRFVITGY